MKKIIKAAAWNNGSHRRSGAGYGFRIDRNELEYFKKLKSVVLVFEVQVNVSESFRDKTCLELRSKEIGLWLRKHFEIPWEKGNPPKAILQPIGKGKFRVSKKQNRKAKVK